MVLDSYDFDVFFKYRDILQEIINNKNGYGDEEFYLYVSKQIGCNRKIKANELRNLIPEMKKNQLIHYRTSDFYYFIDYNGEMAVKYKLCSRTVPKSIKKEERAVGYGFIEIYGEKFLLNGSANNLKFFNEKLQIFDGYEALTF